MSHSDIQVFLNSKVPNCDTWGTQPYAGTTRAQYAASKGYSTPFTCLKDYSMNIQGKTANEYCSAIGSGAKSAAQIIYDVSNACGIRSKVLIVMLEKEQGLVTDDWPWSIQYRSAMGYGCPDTAPCDAEYYGFFNQVYNAAWQFKSYAANTGSFRYRPYQNNNIYWSPNLSCGQGTVYVENRATAGLYNYTPYQPNTAALNNMYGSGDACSAYGNRNFWRLYNDWFGTTLANPYSWAIESYTYSGGDNSIPAGQTETITLRARNNGRVPWYNHGTNPVRLGTWEPAGRYSVLFGGTRLANLQESVVLPGSVGTFTFQVTPTQPGTYVESLNLVAENYTWLTWPGFRPTIEVSKQFNWQIQNVIYSSGTGVMSPSENQLITVVAKNTGGVAWSKLSGPSIKLATWGPDRQSSVGKNWLSNTRVAYMNETTVQPGQTAGFQFYVRMPGTGQYYEKLNIVAEGVAWFNDPGLTLWLYGSDFNYEINSISYSAGTGVMTPGSTQTITVRAKNTGQATWHNNTDFPVKLGTWEPERQSNVADSWLSNTRMSNLLEPSVTSGQIGTFIGQVRMPSTGANYQKMNLVAEGLKWMDYKGLTFYLEGR
jgi:hypothetical protein